MASLNDICYEQIKDSFHFGIFGDFKLVVDKETGYFNATKLCNSGGKHFSKWTRLDKSKKLIKYYENKQNSRCPLKATGSTFYEVKGDNQNENVAKITGQYVSGNLKRVVEVSKERYCYVWNNIRMCCINYCSRI